MAQISFWACILTLTMSVYFVSAQSREHQDDWVDPDDIMRYDSVSKTRMKGDQPRSNQNDWVDPSQPDCPVKCCAEQRVELSTCEGRLSRCEIYLATCRGQRLAEDGRSTCPRKTKANPVKAVETMYMRRFTNILLRVSGLAAVEVGDGSFVKNVLMTVDSEELRALRRFGVDNKMTLGDLDEVLSKVLGSAETGFDIPLPIEWVDYLRYFFSSDEIYLHLSTWAIVLIPTTQLLLHRPPSQVISVFLCLVLLVGYLWEYSYLVKMASVEQQLALERPPPPACRPDAMSWTQSLRHALLGDPDECRKHAVAVNISPARKVTPALVFSALAGNFIAGPLGALGRGLGDFSREFWDRLPSYVGVWLLPLALFLLASIAVTTVALRCGGSVGNAFFSVSGGRQRERRAVEPLSGDAPRPKHVVHHVHHVGSGGGGGRLASQEAAGAALRVPNAWINDSMASCDAAGAPEREAVKDVSPARIVASRDVGKVGKKDAGGGRDSVMLRQIRSLLGEALKGREAATKSGSQGCGDGCGGKSAKSAAKNGAGDSKGGAPLAVKVRLDDEVRLEDTGRIGDEVVEQRLNDGVEEDAGLSGSEAGGGDFLSRVADVLGNDSLSESVVGDDSTAVESAFMLSIQSIMSDDDERG